MKRDPQLEAWCKVLAEPKTAPDVVPPGWFTVRQIATATGKSISHTSETARQKVKQGKAEMRVFRVNSGKRLVPAPHYKLK